MKSCCWFVSVLVMLVAFSASAIDGADKKVPDKKKGKQQQVTLKVRNWRGVEKLVRSHKGKVVVVDIWTTTCGTCIKEFPNFARLEQEFPREKIALVSLNCDYDGIADKPPKFYRADVLKFLRKEKATFDNVLIDIPFIDFLDRFDLASTPSILVYGTDGRLVKRFDNDDALDVEDEFSIDDVKQLISKLLKKKRP